MPNSALLWREHARAPPRHTGGRVATTWSQLCSPAGTLRPRRTGDPSQATFPMRRWRLGWQRRAAPAFETSCWLTCRPGTLSKVAGSLADSARSSALRRVPDACDGRRMIDARVVVVPLARAFWPQVSLVVLSGPSGELEALGHAAAVNMRLYMHGCMLEHLNSISGASL